MGVPRPPSFYRQLHESMNITVTPSGGEKNFTVITFLNGVPNNTPNLFYC